jgi:hypothetical protein
MIPKYLILELDEELGAFRHLKKLLDHEDFPTADLDAALSQLVEVAASLQDFDDHLANAAVWMGAGEGLFENHHLEPAQEEKLINAVVHLGRAIKNKLEHFHAYSGEVCPYKYRSMVDETSILLARAPAV